MIRNALAILSFVGMVVLIAWPSRQSGVPSTVLTRVPFWVLRLLFLLFASTLIACAVGSRRRPKPGFCDQCGYNLKGLTEPRCPECGTTFDQELLEQNA